MNQGGRSAIALVVLWMGLLSAPAITPSVAAEDTRFEQVKRCGGHVAFTRLRIPQNKSETVPLPYSFNDVLVGSAKFIDVVPLSDREIYVLGKELGTTNISILSRDKCLLGLIDVEVGLDTGEIAAKIRSGVGARTIHVSSRDNKIVLSGMAPDASTVDRAVSIAGALAPEGGGVINMLQVASPQQVLLHVRLVEVNRSASRELGVNLFAANGSGTRGINTGLGTVTGAGRLLRDQQGVPVLDANNNPVSTPGSLPLITAAGTLVSGANPYATILATLLHTNGATIDAAITALETRGLARRLAEPNLIALSGDTADFLAGGEFPVPVASTTQAGVPTITVQFKEFGVRLSFTPTVLANGVINLRLEPEVSEIDRSISVSTGAVVVPGLAKRRAKTTVELRDGQSFAIAGLLQSINQSDIDQFPWLGSVPVLGTLFRSTQFQQQQTELVVIVSPHLVKPAAPGDVIATPLDTTVPPNDVDLFLMGKQDLKKVRPAAVEQYVTAAGAVAGPHGHILSQPAPIPDTGPIAPVIIPAATVRVKD